MNLDSVTIKVSELQKLLAKINMAKKEIAYSKKVTEGEKTLFNVKMYVNNRLISIPYSLLNNKTIELILNLCNAFQELELKAIENSTKDLISTLGAKDETS